MLSVGAWAPALAALLILAAPGGGAGYAGEGDQQSPPPASTPVTPQAGDGTIAVTVTSSGSTGEGRSFSSSVQATVAPDCWLRAGRTGYEYYEYWKPGGEARNSGTLDDFAYQGLLHPDYEAHATDDEGRWYEPYCRYDTDAETSFEYYTTRQAVFVPAGDPPPAVDVVVDPQQLVRIAQDSMELPTGTIRWNPSLDGSGATVVNKPTFVWVEGAPADVEVTASVPGVWARVEARVSQLRLDAQNAESASCPDVGTPYTPGMTTSSCSLTFTRSSANLMPPKAGQSLPTATLTATAVWEATWTSSVDPAPQPLDMQTVETSAEIPVAEIQSVVTG
ncbi:hypothetical protein [Cellulomonas sp. KH9]|uniref:hypothetical protein n=1 Tax=Cellulomonas sp. KH9 TaxID=1855324 RepID=UPI0008E69A9F|nr:hypothetical protein [Cellulomonas sp. KH9]SFJ61887.1 hypothetical protein SAMN05216467_0204 [Cellulomonas sp. KH9]